MKAALIEQISTLQRLVVIKDLEIERLREELAGLEHAMEERDSALLALIGWCRNKQLDAEYDAPLPATDDLGL